MTRRGIYFVTAPKNPYKRGRELGIIKDDTWNSVYDGIGIVDNSLTKKKKL